MGSPLERLWKDTMDIYRNIEETVDEVTSSHEELQLPSGVKCHYSGGSLTDTGEDGIPTLINSHTLFCGLNTAKEGDKVIITQHKSGAVITLTVGEGFPRGAGMQYSVKRSDTA
ncbi:MAG: hypothetical protein K0R46_2896 [Herbinix sp.]|jgi:hypothetical protein|nr:hypothetical protein [Herbinix sp.]